MTINYCNDSGAVLFEKKYIDDCRKLTLKLDIKPEYVLALAASETSYGRVGSFVQYNNFFSMETKNNPPSIKYANSYVIAKKTHKDKYLVYVAKFASFYDCTRSFLDRYGNDLKGLKTPDTFANRLVPSFNTAKAPDGDPNFVHKLIITIEATTERLNCK